MCFQGFAHYRCGHSGLYEQRCAHADALDVTFWQALACPWYSSQSRQVAFFCGSGKWYCAQSASGAFLDHVQRERRRADEKFRAASSAIDARWGPLLGRRREQHYARGGTDEQFRASPHVQRVHHILHSLQAEKRAAGRTVEECDRIVGQARQAVRMEADGGLRHARHSGPTAPADGGMEAEAPLASLTAAARPACPHVAPAPFTPATVARLSGLYNPAMALMGASGRPAMTQRDSNATEESSAPVTKKEKTRGAPKRQSVAESATQESARVRRSTRIRGRPVNYAEAASDISKSSSPEKSDASAFAPSKSDLSESPAKKPRNQSLRDGLRARGSPSLLDKIGDWKRRDGGSVGATPRPALGQQYPQASGATPGSPLKNERRSVQSAGVSGITEASRHPFPNARAQPGAREHHANPRPMAPRQEWVVGRDGTDPIISAALAVGGMRRSPLGSQQRPRPSHALPRPRTATPLKRTASAPSTARPITRARPSPPRTSDGASASGGA